MLVVSADPAWHARTDGHDEPTKSTHWRVWRQSEGYRMVCCWINYSVVLSTSRNKLNTVSNLIVVLAVNQFWQVSSPWASSFPRKWHFTEKSRLILSSEEGVRWRRNVSFYSIRFEIVFNLFLEQWYVVVMATVLMMSFMSCVWCSL